MFSRPYARVLVAVAAALCLPALLRAEATGIAWREDLDAAKIEAAQSGRLLLLHFWTPTCGPCMVLEQNVLSQPQVGLAVERGYVPVKINADAKPAVTNMYRIERVPTEVVITPQGAVVATLPIQDTPDAYVAQLDKLAQYVRQTTPSAGGGPAASINSAYAGLPQSGAAAGQQPAAQSIAAPAPQTNPYVVAAPTSQPTQAVAPPTRQAPATSFAGGSSSAPATALAGGSTMPANAMPRSYRDPSPAVPTSGNAAAGSANGATPSTNSAYTGLAASAAAAPASSTLTTGSAAATPATSAAAQVAQVQPAQPPLPANCPPIGFDGCCPVTLKTLNKWAPGSTSFGAIHRGRTYLFVGEEQRQQFLADPDSYSPVFAGYDPVLLLEKQQTVPGSRKYGFKYGNAFYLFSCVETRDKFQTSPQTYAAGVRQAMAKVDGAADVSGTIRR